METREPRGRSGPGVDFVFERGELSSVSPWLPLTHGIAAARTLADGATFSSVGGDLVREAGIGALYVLIGMAMLSYFEWESRRRATLEVF